MMKRIYICLLMLMVLSTATFAQKKGSPEYNAQLRATVIAMDSVLKNSRVVPEILMRFADEQCAKFKNDPDLMSAIADLFLTSYNNEIYSNERYTKLKQMYPNYIDAYLNEASLFHSRAWIDAPAYDIKFLQNAKNQIDSAKILFPTNPEPYMKWVRMQAPFRNVRLGGYENLTLDHELEELHKKFPTYPCYLEIARYYDERLSKKKGISEKDMINYIVYSAEFYDKAGANGEMSAPYWQNYAWLWYSYNLDEDKTKGVKVAEQGLKQYPNYPGLLRMKMWNEGKAKMWADLIETSKQLFQYADTLKPSYLDYKWLAQAYKNTENYTEAIEYYNKELELVNDTTERLNVLLNKVQCYNNARQYKLAMSAFSEFEDFKRATHEPLDFYSYQYLQNVYIKIVIDTTQVVSDRIFYCHKLDSLFEISAETTPAEALELSEKRLNYLVYRQTLEYGEWGYSQAALPEVLDLAGKLSQMVLDKSNSLNDYDYYVLMEGYYYQLLHYLGNNDYENAYRIAEKMTSPDLPFEVKGKGTNNKNYQIWVDEGQRNYTTLYKKYGKKR